FCCRTTAGPSAANDSARPRTVSSRRSMGTAWFTRPHSRARAASISSPVSSSQALLAAPIRRGINAACITDGMPTLTSGMPNCAESAQLRRSRASANASPPPRHQPGMRAMTGAGKWRTASQRSRKLAIKRRAFCSSRPAISAMSAPATNARSLAPRSTNTRTDASLAKRARATRKPSITGVLRKLTPAIADITQIGNKAPRLLFVEAGHPGNVRPRHERAVAGAAQHQHAHRRILGQACQGHPQTIDHRRAQDIEHAGVLDGQRGDARRLDAYAGMVDGKGLRLHESSCHYIFLNWMASTT